uniref:beta-ketoacyl-[acyl-carrier-protein] synthase I n=1 Tax=Anopheles atroparvus TaxID=41427 RepID=A0AAG5CVB4_ANOAO
MVPSSSTYCLLRARRNVSFVLRNLHQTLPTQQSRADRRRVVITGLGVVSPVGCSVDTAWRTILAGQSKIGHLVGDSYEKLPCRVAATIDKDDIDLEKCFSKTELKTMARATAFALIAAKEALTTAGW